MASPKLFQIVMSCLVMVRHGGELKVDRRQTRREGEDRKNPSDHGTVIHLTLPNKTQRGGGAAKP